MQIQMLIAQFKCFLEIKIDLFRYFQYTTKQCKMYKHWYKYINRMSIWIECINCGCGVDMIVSISVYVHCTFEYDYFTNTNTNLERVSVYTFVDRRERHIWNMRDTTKITYLFDVANIYMLLLLVLLWWIDKIRCKPPIQWINFTGFDNFQCKIEERHNSDIISITLMQYFRLILCS